MQPMIVLYIVDISYLLRLPIMEYAIGAAMNNDDSVPKITPSIIAKAKLLMLSPPRMNIHSNTTNVLSDVFMVRASVVFSESLKSENLSCLG